MRHVKHGVDRWTTDGRPAGWPENIKPPPRIVGKFNVP